VQYQFFFPYFLSVRFRRTRGGPFVPLPFAGMPSPARRGVVGRGPVPLKNRPGGNRPPGGGGKKSNGTGKKNRWPAGFPPLGAARWRQKGPRLAKPGPPKPVRFCFFFPFSFHIFSHGPPEVGVEGACPPPGKVGGPFLSTRALAAPKKPYEHTVGFKRPPPVPPPHPPLQPRAEIKNARGPPAGRGQTVPPPSVFPPFEPGLGKIQRPQPRFLPPFFPEPIAPPPPPPGSRPRPPGPPPPTRERGRAPFFFFIRGARPGAPFAGLKTGPKKLWGRGKPKNKNPPSFGGGRSVGDLIGRGHWNQTRTHPTPFIFFVSFSIGVCKGAPRSGVSKHSQNL